MGVFWVDFAVCIIAAEFNTFGFIIWYKSQGFWVLILFIMKGSDGDSSKTPKTLVNLVMEGTFDQGRPLALERSNQELKDSMM